MYYLWALVIVMPCTVFGISDKEVMMSTAKMIELPKLPHGEGTMSYDLNGNIVYKKWIVLSDGSKYRKTITGSTIPECFRKMMKEEDTASYLKPVEYNSSKCNNFLTNYFSNTKFNTGKSTPGIISVINLIS